MHKINPHKYQRTLLRSYLITDVQSMHGASVELTNLYFHVRPGHVHYTALISIIIMHRLDKGLESLRLHNCKTDTQLHILGFYFSDPLFYS